MPREKLIVRADYRKGRLVESERDNVDGLIVYDFKDVRLYYRRRLATNPSSMPKNEN